MVWQKKRLGGVSLTVLTGMLPQCVLVTDGKTHDLRAVQDLRFNPDDLLIFDRAYLDYAWLYQLHQDGVWFATRLKSNSCYEVIQDQAASGPVLADQSHPVEFPSRARPATLSLCAGCITGTRRPARNMSF